MLLTQCKRLMERAPARLSLMPLYGGLQNPPTSDGVGVIGVKRSFQYISHSSSLETVFTVSHMSLFVNDNHS